MPPGRKSISTSSKSSLSTNDHPSPNSNKSLFGKITINTNFYIPFSC